MQKPEQITTLNWQRLKDFANPLEDDINDALDTVLSLAESHRHCPGSIEAIRLMDSADRLATKLQTALNRITTPSPRQLPPQPVREPQDPSSSQIPPSSSTRTRTRTQMNLAMLQYLSDHGGQGTATQMYQHIRDMDPPLDGRDLQLRNDGTPRWRRVAERARYALAARQLIQKGISPNTWTLTREGAEELQRLLNLAQETAQPDPTPHPDSTQDQSAQDQEPRAQDPQDTQAPVEKEPTPNLVDPQDQHPVTHKAPQQNGQEPTQMEPEHSNRQTSQNHYRQHILEYLDQQDGRAPAHDVISHIGRTMADRFNTIDLQPTPKGEPRWKAIVNNARLQLARDGLLRADSPTGTWELSQKGLGLVQQHQSP